MEITTKGAADLTNTIELVLSKKKQQARRSPTQIANINEALGLTDQLRTSLGGLMQLEAHEFIGEKQAQ